MRNVKKALVVGALAPLALTLFLLAFLWPMATMEPRDISTAVVGEPQQVAQIQKALDEKKPGLFKTQPASDRAEAERLVQQREVSGAIVLGQEPEVLYSSAAGLPQANIIKNLSQPLSEMANHQAKAVAQARGLPEHKVPSVDVKARDLAPLDSRDPQGAGINFSILPVAFGGMIGAALISFVLQKNTQRLLAFAVYAPLGGLLVSWVYSGVFDLLPAGFWTSAGVFTLGIAASSSFIVGLRALFGTPGFGLGALAIMLIGNPLAGTMAPKEFIASPWGALGQLFPNAATASLTRSVNYFPLASISTEVWTLLAWIAVGLCALAAGIVKERKQSQHENPAAEESTQPQPA